MASNRSKRMLQSVLAVGSDNIPRKKKKQNAVNSSHILFSEDNMGAPESPIPEHNEDELIQLQDLLGGVFIDEHENSNCDRLINDEDVSPIPGEEEIIPPSSADLEKYESSTLRPNIVSSSAVNVAVIGKRFDVTLENFPETPTEIDNLTSRSPRVLSDIIEVESEHIPQDKFPGMHNITLTSSCVIDATVLDSENNPQNASDTPVPSPIHLSHHNCNSQFCSNCSPIQNDSTYPDFDAPTPSTVASIGSPYTPSASKPRKKTYKTDESKKRKVRKENWQSTQRKINKNEGKSFTTAKGKLIDEKTIKDPCTLKCRMKCFEKISQEQRLKIFKKFWSIGDRTLQWKYVLKFTDKVNKARHTTKETKHDRQFTYSYYLPSEEKEKVKVCKTMFINTISSGERIVSTAWKKDRGYNIIEPDNRGKYHHKKTVIDEEMIRSVCDHVNSFPLVESHRIRKDSKKKYLDGIDSVSRMFKLYCEWGDLKNYSNRALTKRQYRDIVNEKFNLAIHRPKKDVCDMCHTFMGKKTPTDIEIKKQEVHLQHKETARLQKIEDKKEALENQKLVVATFDFQKVLTTPHGEVSILYYKRKLPTLNFTVYNCADKTAKCYMWHEGIAKRGSNEVSSCLYNFIKEHAQKGVEEFRFWSDNCGGQNRNRIVFTLYMLAAREFNVTITHRFLEKGHTQNEGDSVHSVIERASGRKMIYVPEEWYCLVRWAKSEGEPYVVHEMDTSDFYNIKKLLKTKYWAKNTSNEKVQWSRLREVKVNKTEFDRLEYKYQIGQLPKTIVVVKCPTRNNTQRLAKEFQLMNAYDGPLPLTYAKHKDLVDLCISGIIPEKYHQFYKDLPHQEKGQKKKRNVAVDSYTDSDTD